MSNVSLLCSMSMASNWREYDNQKNTIMKKEFVMTDAFRRDLERLVENAVSNAIEKQKAKSALLKTEEVVQAYGVSRTTLWRLVKAGAIHAIKGRGRQLLFNAEECKRVLARPIDK